MRWLFRVSLLRSLERERGEGLSAESWELNIIIIYKIILHNYSQFHLNERRTSNAVFFVWWRGRCCLCWWCAQRKGNENLFFLWGQCSPNIEVAQWKFCYEKPKKTFYINNKIIKHLLVRRLWKSTSLLRAKCKFNILWAHISTFE